MRENIDEAVIGAGVVGLTTAYHLAREGRRVLLLEQFKFAHDRGQSYGKSRAFSVAYDTAERVKLALQSRAGWHDLEEESGEQIFFQTGGIDLVESAEELVSLMKTRDTMKELGIDYEELDCGTIKQKIPVWRLREEAFALYSPDDGILYPDGTIRTLLGQTIRFGAMIRDQEPVTKILYGGSKIEIVTTKSRYTARNIVIACGAWTNKVLAHLNFSLPIQTSQAQTVYFLPKTNVASFAVGVFPIWHHDKKPLVYGFPIFGEPGIKVGFHQDGLDVNMEEYNAIPSVSVINRLRAYLEEYLPDAAGRAFGARTCLYDNTPDKEFIVDRVPGFTNVFVGAGFSGHGFGPAITTGRALADLVLYGSTEIEIGLFKIDRFLQA